MLGQLRAGAVGNPAEVVKSELRKHAPSLHTQRLVINNEGWTNLAIKLDGRSRQFRITAVGDKAL